MKDLAKPIVRFAPSPTGRLHIGNLRTALYNWLFAKGQGGSFILRLDDTDTERSTDAFAQGIVEDLAWIGIVPDASDKQSNRVAQYDAAAAKLKEAGLLYPCYETPDEIERRRKRLMARGLPPIYERTGLKQTNEERAALEAEGRTAHWRFLLPNFTDDPFSPTRTEVHWDDAMRGEQTVDLASMSDPVLIRGDGTYLYTLPSVVDDSDMGVTHVIRGGDHITNTGAQIALFKALGAQPPAFGHHNLLTDASGDGLSKRTGALSLASLREGGIEPMALASLAALIGTGQAVEVCSSMDELAQLFDPTKVSRSPARFDERELEAMNEKLLHAMPYAEAQPRLTAKGMDHGEAFWNAVRPNLARFDDVAQWHSVLEGNFVPLVADVEDEEFLAVARDMLPAEPWPDDVWKQWTSALKEKTSRKGKALFMPLRKALTGKEHGPDMGEFLPLIGPEKTARRLS
ncbi:glutamate--tRNA ligase [Pseudahrensia aquimaris]|uniref:Glutamate--tRNA ligase n=1 Tax=Pseudahrensia aquimaris TaxID=744461 RepID=A0ABW3FHN2_9HYPH